MIKESKIISAILPRRCVFCGKVAKRQDGICDKCRESLPVIKPPVCGKCGREKKMCSCRRGMTFYDGVTAPFSFEGNVRRGVHLFKFSGRKPGGAYFGKFIADKVKESFHDVPFDLVLCVPQSRKKLKTKPYNHGEIIARSVSEELGIPFEQELLAKIYETESQHDLGVLLRRGNLSGVFTVTEPEKIKGKRILLVDDIMTSGETLNECAKMLCLAYAESVQCAVLAVTNFKK